MKIQIQTEDLELKPYMEEAIYEKLARYINKLLSGFNFDPDTMMATIRIEKGHRWGFKISWSMTLPKKKHIYAETKDEEFVKATTKLKEEVEKQIRRYKDKVKAH